MTLLLSCPFKYCRFWQYQDSEHSTDPSKYQIFIQMSAEDMKKSGNIKDKICAYSCFDDVRNNVEERETRKGD